MIQRMRKIGMNATVMRVNMDSIASPLLIHENGDSYLEIEKKRAVQPSPSKTSSNILRSHHYNYMRISTRSGNGKNDVQSSKWDTERQTQQRIQELQKIVTWVSG